MMKHRNRNKDWPYWAMVAFILAAMSYAYNAKAEERLYIGAVTEHFSGGDYNETHELVMIEYGSVIAGYTPNSYDEDTFLLGGKARIPALDLPIRHLETSGIAAATYGYRSCSKGWSDTGRDVCGMAGLMFDYTKYKRYHPSVVLTPVFIGLTGAIVF